MICLFAFLFDSLLGDPHGKWHPVALIGTWIAWLERHLYDADVSVRMQYIAGMVVSLLTLFLVYDITELLLALILYIDNVYIQYAVQGLLLSFMICPRSLAQAGMEIYHYLLHHHIQLARTKVGWIVGRDTDQLDEGEIVRATVETVAENTIDGIVSPLFFFAIGGLPLAVVYRASNTLDSMIAYKNERYLYFGRFAAHVDDVLNYIPARMSALFFILASMLLRHHWRNAWHMMRCDAAKHPSPNGGYAEATVAGALGIRLGGYNSYFGKTTFRAYMGDALQPLAPHHIRQTVHLMYVVTIMAVLLAAWCQW